MPVMWGDYASPGFWDELIDGSGRPRPGAELVVARLVQLGPELLERQRTAERTQDKCVLPVSPQF